MLENITRANDAIVALMDRLNLSKLFKKEEAFTHTSSDGQKFNVAVNSIHANYSYKYFGKEKGISIYSFIDDSHRLFYSTVFSSSEREAGYVIDGLMHNEVVQSDIHSTDTHGFSELIFALTYLLGIEFAPRIKNFQEQKLYTMNGVEVPSLNEYTVKLGDAINTNLIEEHWDTVLQMVATIKLKHTTASSLLRRLNSYSNKHPLYLALKELGKVIKTLFLLRYMDDEALRSRIEGQLNKLESAHQFARAVFYGNNGAFQFASKEQQLVTEGCKRLVENAIICWNYLYLTKLIIKAQPQDRALILEVISQSSVVSWQHINLQGEFDFSDEILKDSLNFDLEELLRFQIEK